MTETSEAAVQNLTFVSEARASNHLAGWFFIGLGLLIGGVGFLQPDAILWHLLGGALLAGVGGLVLYSISGDYPRLRLHGPALWVENRWRSSRPFNLHELGAAHVIEVVTIMNGRNLREYCLCFLRREEEQALLDAGKPLPTDASAYYKVMSLATLLPYDRTRSDEIASVINTHRPAWVPELSEADRKLLSRAPGNRQFVYLVALFTLAAVLILIVFLLQSAS